MLKATSIALALTVVAAALPASSASARQWYVINFSHATCQDSQITPDQFHTQLAEFGNIRGYVVEARIAPEDVVKDPDGSIHVTVRATHNGNDVSYEFFTWKPSCDKYISDNSITPLGANHDDVN